MTMSFTENRRWIPFVIFILLIIIFSGYFLSNVQPSNYHPVTDDPAVIYYEACSHCHGKNGKSNNVFYPDLANEEMERAEVEKVIREGALFMPAFQKLKGDTLQNLVDYVLEKRFIK